MTGPVPADLFDEDFDDALAVLARTRLDVFAQYVLRNEQPDVADAFDSDELELDDAAKWTAADTAALEARVRKAMVELNDEDADAITLERYHFGLLDTFRRKRRVVVTAHTESGKTQLAIAYVLWRLGNNPSLRVAFISEGAALARTICRTVAKYIADESFAGCQALRRVFPNLRPGKLWNEMQGYEVERPAQVTHPSFRAFGSRTGITGYRVDIGVCDDYVTPKTTETDYKRKQNIDNFDRSVQNRLTRRGQLILLCNAQWSDDLSAVLEQRGYTPVRMRVTTDGTPEGPLEWPSKWTRQRIREAVRENPDWRAALFAERRKVGEWGRFDQGAIMDALREGRGARLGGKCPPLPSGAMICIGVDFAFSTSRKSDRSAIVTVLRMPPSPGERMGKRIVLDIECGRWNEKEGLERLRSVVQRYPVNRTRVRAESNGGQAWIIQSWTRSLGQVLEPYATGATKWDPQTGIPSLSAAFLNRLYVLPSEDVAGRIEPLPLVAELITEMGAFDPSKAGLQHTGDLLMALFFAEGLARDLAHVEPRFGFVGEAVTDEAAAAEGRALELAREAALKGGPIPAEDKPPPPAAEVESRELWGDLRDMFHHRADGRPAF